MKTEILNTLNGIKADLANGKRLVKNIAAECAFFEAQVSDDLSKSIFARLADCTSRKQFNAVLNSL